jgi:hypothetical protein
MRVLLAGLFVFGGFLGCAAVVCHYFPEGFERSWLMGLFLSCALACVLLVLGVAAFFVFNRYGLKPLRPGRSVKEQIADLERQGLLFSNTFHAARAFQVEEFEDEGPHYFIELTDRTVLYLSGQYLDEYEEITDDPGFNHPRRFPCTEFTIRRHKDENDAVDIACHGDVLHPECLAPSFGEDVFRTGATPEDGQVIRDRSYEQLKSRCLEGKRFTG